MELTNVNLQDLAAALQHVPSQDARATVTINGETVCDLRPVGRRLWFEYHCLESPLSADACIWYRSHQQVLVLGFAECDPPALTTRVERMETGHPLLYRVRFDDGLEWDVFEDELLDSPEEFERPNPPAKR